jgi:hypothetical protein
VEGIRYDRLQIGSHSIAFAIIAMAALVCIAVGIYELVAAVVSKLMSLFRKASGAQGS